MALRISRLAIATVALTALVAIAVPALGGGQQTVRIDSRLTVSAVNQDVFAGRVKADIHACIEQRRVKVFKRRDNGGRRQLGNAVTNNQGRWRVIAPIRFDRRYLAVVTRQEQGTAGTIYVCRRDQQGWSFSPQ